MSILQELEKCLNSDATSYMEFLYRYDPKKKQVFAFYEGDEDSSFYHHFLKNAIGDDCELEEIIAGCKNNILKLHEKFNWNKYSAQQIIFFVDRDLSYWLDEKDLISSNIFVTDGYSVENYIVNSQGFKAWLIHFEGFARAKQTEINEMILEYNKNIAIFEKKMMLVMATAIVAKRHDNSISLSEFKLSTNKNLRFEILNKHITFKIHGVHNILKKWNLTSEYRAEIFEQLNLIKRDIVHYSVRGKWSLCFLAEIGEFMRLNPKVFAPSLNREKLSPTCAVPATQCFSALAPYCTETIPSRLNDFLNVTYQLYLKRFSC